MVLAKFTRIVAGIAFFIMLSAIFSCEELIIVDCNECQPNEPDAAMLDIKLEENRQAVLITVYEGTPENNIIFDQFTTYSQSESLSVILNKSYTLTAEYKKGDRTDIAVNSVRPRVKLDEVKCDEPCYFIYDTKVDLTLKNSR